MHSGNQIHDGAHILYINGEIQDDTALGCLMSDMFCESPKDMHYKELAERVSYLKDEKGGIYTMCEFSEALINQGREQGIEQGVTRVAQNMLRKNTPIELVVELTGLTVSQVEKLAEEMAIQVK